MNIISFIKGLFTSKAALPKIAIPKEQVIELPEYLEITHSCFIIYCNGLTLLNILDYLIDGNSIKFYFDILEGDVVKIKHLTLGLVGVKEFKIYGNEL